ncbi:hypothetical protein ANN_08403 [Periplaneta americana]|uniref:Uncharacterized protein n=1 Tax=Periplaneta americana TaxID=6978 RepID=A0ABQ8T1B6_PERAM|nr:hypothetical protein ANN_08403 [Periplaneta americana]
MQILNENNNAFIRFVIFLTKLFFIFLIKWQRYELEIRRVQVNFQHERENIVMLQKTDFDVSVEIQVINRAFGGPPKLLTLSTGLHGFVKLGDPAVEPTPVPTGEGVYTTDR